MALEQMPAVFPVPRPARPTLGAVVAMPPSAMLQPVVDMACRALAAPMAMLILPRAGNPGLVGAGVPAGLQAELARLCEDRDAGGRPAPVPFRASAPLVADGAVLGALNVFDVVPRPVLDASRQAELDTLARLAVQLVTTQERAILAAQHASAAARMADHAERQFRACLGLVGTAFQARARQSAEPGQRETLFGAADAVAGLEAALDQLRSPLGFAGDIRAFLLALIGNLQEAAGDCGRCPILLRTPDPLPLMAEEQIALIGRACLALLVRGLRHECRPITLTLQRDDGLLLSIDQRGPAPAPDPQDRAMLALLAALAVPGGVSIDGEAGQRITIRLE